MGALGRGALPEDLAAHAASCPHCRAAVAAYRALAPPAGGSASRSPSSLSPALERELSEAAGKRAPSPLRGPLLLGLLQAAVAIGAIAALGKSGWVRNQEPPAVLVSLAIALAACAVGGTLAAVAPGYRQLRTALFALATATAAVLGVCGNGLPGQRSFAFDGAVCASVELGCAALPLGVALWLQRRFAFDPLRAAAASLAAAATGVFALHLHCPIGAANHLYAFHVAPWVVLGGLGLWLRSRMASRSYAP
ncbi:MAG TPA: DUF1109 domain-containing protein [Myxococcaceae bacterium]